MNLNTLVSRGKRVLIDRPNFVSYDENGRRSTESDDYNYYPNRRRLASTLEKWMEREQGQGEGAG